MRKASENRKAVAAPVAMTIARTGPYRFARAVLATADSPIVMPASAAAPSSGARGHHGAAARRGRGAGAAPRPHADGRRGAGGGGGVATRRDVKVTAEQGVRGAEAASLAAILFGCRRLVGIVVV